MAKKFIKDAVFTSRAEALAALAEAHTTATTVCGLDLETAWQITRDNLPTMTAEDGEQASPLAWDETGAPVLAPDADCGNLALVTIYSDQSAPQPEGEPAAIPAAIYLLTLPTAAEIMGNDKLQDYAAELVNRALLSSARKIAKANATDPEANPLARDRVAALIEANARKGGDPATRAFKALFPVMQGAILSTVSKQVDALKEQKRHADARLLAATYNKARLNSDTLRECLMSEEAAKRHFPQMPQKQWENLLAFAIQWAPKHFVMKIVKDATGQTIKETDPDTGKERAKRERHTNPQSPVPFMAWLETRSTRTLAPTDAPTVDFSDMEAPA